MDGHRFDDVARLIGRGASRRSVLAGILGTIGAIGIDRGIASAGNCLTNGTGCETNGICCSGFCNPDTDLCDDECIQSGDSCEIDDDCCGDLRCISNGEVTVCTEACLEIGTECSTNDECCSNICAGTCILESCVSNDGACKADGMCCSGFCDEGVCATACFDDGVDCTTSDDCCSGLCDGVLLICATCFSAGNDCKVDGDCCSDLVCLDGVCAPNPSTGAITLHVNSCPSGTGDLFGSCHNNNLAGIQFNFSSGVNANGIPVNVPTSDSKGHVGPIEIVAGSVTITDISDTQNDYVGNYVFCSSQTSGDVLFDSSADDGVVVIDLKADDDIICDWYKLTKPAQPTVTATAAATSTPKTGGVTELPATGVAGGDSDGSTASVIGAAAVAGAAALIVGRKLIASRETSGE